ncbi:MAG TPA: PD-(D/E)XK nuclease family protein, partial [Candidatus Tectomicrobia bacterium]|nr:PD-(D/E)XK nuclease family protein [Candidatus Tectomicrobia bacterium]
VFLAASASALDDAHAEWRRALAAAGFAEERAPALEPDAAPAIAQLARSVFRPERAAFEPDGITLISAADTVREVWEAARACTEWARDGIAFHEIAVAYRNRDPYHGLVEEVFREAGIPTYLHDGSLLSRHPLGRRILLLLHLARDGEFSRRHVTEFLTETRISGGVRQRFPGFRPSEWEAYSREAGVVAGIDQWRERLARLAAEKREKANDERFEWLRPHAERVEEFARFIEDFHAAIERRHAQGAWDEHLAWLREITTAYADGVSPIVEALGDLAALAAVRPVVSFDEFCRAAEDDLGSRDASRVLGEPVREFGKHGVAVVDHTALRHLRFRAVCLLGVAERAWPPPVRPDPLLLEHERANLNTAGAGHLPLRTEPDDETITFWLALQSARERLTVSYARADASGSGRHVPSYFFRAIADAVRGHTLDLESLETSGLVTRINAGRLACASPAEALTLTEYDRSLVRAFAERGEAGAVGAIAASWPSFPRAVAARASRWGRALSPFDGLITGEESLRALAAHPLGADRPVSPTRLETYAECPYRYFMRYVLHVEPLAEPESLDRMDNLERGSLIHAVLERFLRTLGRDDPPSFTRREVHIALLREALDTECAALEARGVTGRALLWQLDRTQIFEDLERWYDRECLDQDGLKPGALEASFGIAGPPADGVSRDDPLVVDVDGRTLRFQGRIDRLDWDDARTRFRVIDYKTGKRKAVKGYEGGEKLQLPVYLLAAADMLGLPPEAGRAEYFFATSGGGFRREPFDGRTLADTRGDFDAVLSTIARGVDGGFFAPNPGKNGDNCRWCDYKDVCDVRIARIAERKQEDGRGAAFRAMKEIP